MQRGYHSGNPADVYHYDTLSQLTQVWYGADATDPAAMTSYDHLQGYTLDPMGNRLNVQHDSSDETYRPNNGQKLTNPMHRYEQVGTRSLSYDPKGNVVSDGRNSYAYDIFNRQIRMTGPGGTAEYVYDALGRRVAKVINGVTTYSVYNTSYQVLEERNSSNLLVARYTYGAGIDELLTMERNGTRYTYHRDALGSITEITDASGSLVERYEYDVYGKPRFFDRNGNPLIASNLGNSYLFTGRQYDSESGNYNYRARMYSPVLGRFLQMDPVGYVDGMNLYAYVGNNPVSFTDAGGRTKERPEIPGYDYNSTYTVKGKCNITIVIGAYRETPHIYQTPSTTGVSAVGCCTGGCPPDPDSEFGNIEVPPKEVTPFPGSQCLDIHSELLTYPDGTGSLFDEVDKETQLAIQKGGPALCCKWKECEEITIIYHCLTTHSEVKKKYCSEGEKNIVKQVDCKEFRKGEQCDREPENCQTN